MHEAGAVREALAQLLESARGEMVAEVELLVEASDHVSEEIIRLHFERLARGTAAGSARLLIEWLPVRLRCCRCGGGYLMPAPGPTPPCPGCGGLGLPENPAGRVEVSRVRVGV